MQQRPAESLAKELAAMMRLQELLQAEQTALVEGAADSLPELVKAKAFLISEITILADGRHQSLVAAGFEASEDSMQKWVETTGVDTEKKTWSDLLTLARDVKEQNRVNGLLINKHMQTNQQIMGLFEGQVGNSFYGPDGQSNLKTSPRKFGAV